jgi:acyl carrier protein
VRDKIIGIVGAILDESVSGETSMENTPSWDSLKTLLIVMALDEEGISLPFEKIAEIRSVADIIEITCESAANEP